MGHLQRMENKGVRKGAWTEEEDILLRKCIDKYGEGNWRLVPVRAGGIKYNGIFHFSEREREKYIMRTGFSGISYKIVVWMKQNVEYIFIIEFAGLRRCRKSCRLRWLNYLHPNIKRGEFEEDEVDLIIRLHKLLGNRWSLIAGRIPGRTANDIKNYWNSHLKKKVGRETNLEKSRTEKTKTKVIKPQARTFSSSSKWLNGFGSSTDVQPQPIFSSATLPAAQEDSISWWKRVLADEEEEENGTINLSSGVGQELPERFGVEEEERMGKGGGAMMEVGEWDDIELDLGIWGLLGTLSLML